MKKLLNIIVLAAFATFASCDLDKTPDASLPQDEAFDNIETIKFLEKGAYSRLRSSYTPASMIVPDIQADYMHAVFGFSNTFGEVYKWTFTHSDYEVADTWNYLYAGIGQYNYIIDGIEQRLGFTPTEAEAATLDRIRGNMYLMRAMSYSLLAERFCADYDAATAKNEYSGVPLVVTYSPEDKPSRATLFDVYDRILKDIATAKTLLAGVVGKANSTALNVDCATALEAHVLLQMDNYPEALKVANSLIGSPAYALVGSADELRQMWTSDKSSEIIFVFYASRTELPAQFGINMFSDYFNGQKPYSFITSDYIPTQDCVNAFDAADWRRPAYFVDANYEQTAPDGRDYIAYFSAYGGGTFCGYPSTTVFSKYLNNPNLQTSTSWNYRNAWKPFRLAEMYLIAAEAAVRSGDDAATPLNTLREHRGLPALATVTLDDVKAERYRELMMEGMRLTDLKRWGDGMTRGKEQTGYLINDDDGKIYQGNSWITPLAEHIEIEAGDYRFVWPIPSTEIFANQNLANQQNPGWER